MTHILLLIHLPTTGSEDVAAGIGDSVVTPAWPPRYSPASQRFTASCRTFSEMSGWKSPALLDFMCTTRMNRSLALHVRNVHLVQVLHTIHIAQYASVDVHTLCADPQMHFCAIRHCSSARLHVHIHDMRFVLLEDIIRTSTTCVCFSTRLHVQMH
jgi:hypothetical protein